VACILDAAFWRSGSPRSIFATSCASWFCCSGVLELLVPTGKFDLVQPPVCEPQSHSTTTYI
jgi:hypothetical protein